MSKVSIIIPCRDTEDHINKTVENIYQNATGEFEVIIGYDGPHFWSLQKDYPNLRSFEADGDIGLKIKINALAAMATGKYIFKLDSHCAVGKGFDEILKADMEEDWIVMPRFKIIKDDWSIQMRDGVEEFYDYFFLSCPFTDPRGFRFKAGGHWGERTKERDPWKADAVKIDHEERSLVFTKPFIDETPQIHGSGWMMTKDRFFELGGFPNIDPYGHAQEPPWLALKNWLIGGKVMVNKKTWYAHLHQDGSAKTYRYTREQERHSYDIAAKHFVEDKGHYLHNFEWFIEKFMPMPSWPEDWQERLRVYKALSIEGRSER